MKDPLPTLKQRNVVHQIPCSDCSSVYVGQPGWRLFTRVKGHKGVAIRQDRRRHWDRVAWNATSPCVNQGDEGQHNPLSVKRQRGETQLPPPRLSPMSPWPQPCLPCLYNPLPPPSISLTAPNLRHHPLFQCHYCFDKSVPALRNSCPLCDLYKKRTPRETRFVLLSEQRCFFSYNGGKTVYAGVPLHVRCPPLIFNGIIHIFQVHQTVITRGLQTGPMRKCALHFLKSISSLYLILSL